MIRECANALGSSEKASELFPHLLLILALHSNNGSVVEEFSQHIDKFGSTRSLLRWIPQMLSHIDSIIFVYIYPILLKVGARRVNMVDSL